MQLVGSWGLYHTASLTEGTTSTCFDLVLFSRELKCERATRKQGNKEDMQCATQTEDTEYQQLYPSESSEYQSAESQISSPVSEWVSDTLNIGFTQIASQFPSTLMLTLASTTESVM